MKILARPELTLLTVAAVDKIPTSQYFIHILSLAKSFDHKTKASYI